MPDEDDRQSEDIDPSQIEEQTKSLLDEVLQSAKIPVTEEDGSSDTMNADDLDGSFKRLINRIEDIFASIEDSLKNVEPEIDAQIAEKMISLGESIKSAGLGVFGSRAIAIVKDELKEITAKELFDSIYKSIHAAHAKLIDAVEKVGRGTTKSVGRSTETLQARLIRLYTTVTDLEQQLETTRTTVIRWRGKAKELSEVASTREEMLDESQTETQRLLSLMETMDNRKEERNLEISALKGELSEATSLIEQQKELLSKLENAQDISIEYEKKLSEVSQLQGQVVELQERNTQKDESLEALRAEMDLLQASHQEMDTKHKTILSESARMSGLVESYQSEVESLTVKIAEMNARWDMLFQVAEEEPSFKAYFVIAGKTHWFPLGHLSSALGIPLILLKRQMQKFIDAGLVEIKDDKIRPLNLSDVARKAAGFDARLIEEAISEVDKIENFELLEVPKETHDDISTEEDNPPVEENIDNSDDY